MNRTWITGLTLATVAGTGAAFAGVVVNSHDSQANAEALTPPVPQALLQVEPTATTTPGRTLSYQVGAAGVATLTIANGSLNVDNATAGTGWLLKSSSGPGTHVDVRFTDGTQLVTFGADLVGTDVVVVSLTNAPDPAAVVATVPQPTTVTVANTEAHTLGQTTAQPQAALPPTTVAPVRAPAPPKAATTAPSGSSTHEGSDDGQESNDD
ncbi:MAG: hypothetical protein ACXVIH_05210 [Ilumatobacteraceae bacterium]